MNIQKRTIENFIDGMKADYDGVDLSLSEIDETLAVLDKRVILNQNLKKKIKLIRQEKKTAGIRNAIKRKISGRVKTGIKKIGRVIDFSLHRKIEESGNNSVCVIIPTYKPNDYIYESIQSVLAQKNVKKIEIIISVNGEDKVWCDTLTAKYQTDNIKVIYTPKKGPSVARNNGVKNTDADFIFFLDDDDTITEGLISELLAVMGPKTIVSIAPYYDSDKGLDNYITNGLIRFLSKKMKKIKPSETWSVTATGKLFRRELFIAGSPFNEEASISEDIIFWADNFDKLKSGGAACVSPEKEEYYRRLVREDSMSGSDDKLKFIKDRIGVIGQLENKLFSDDYSWAAKEAIIRLISAQQTLMKRQFVLCSDCDKSLARQAVNGYQGIYINKGNYSDEVAIGVCHNFSPYIDASSMVSTRRLKEIEDIENSHFQWNIVCKNMSDIREIDTIYEKFFSKQIYSEKVSIGGRTSMAPRKQVEFALRAYNRVKNLEAKLIYSRTMFPGSHIAAYLYKREHPETIWYAEFSDPLQKDIHGNWRQEEHNTQTPPAYLNDFWEVCETMPYQYADTIIFTNENQRDYMLSYNRCPEYNDNIIKKSLILRHPSIEENFVKLRKNAYHLDDAMINIGYFGSFYDNRSLEEIKPLTANSNVRLHVFTLSMEHLSEADSFGISVNPPLPYFEFLNLASKMDYLVLNDMESSFGIIPWLPSKYGDYVSTGTKIIAKCFEGSPLSKMEYNKLIKVNSFDKSFVKSLTKQRKSDK